MSKRLMFSIVVLLIITNIATLVFLTKNDLVRLDNEGETQIANNDSVASIAKEDILYKDWIKSLRETYGQKHLKKMIDHKVVEQLSKQSDIQVSEKVIEYEIALLTTMQGVMTDKQAKASEARWREDILYRYKLEALLTEDVIIPEEEVRRYYDEYGKQYDFTASKQYSHILVEDFEIGEKIVRELEEGASFNLLAQEYSSDKETRSAGGYLGYFTKDSQFLPSGYYEVAADMKENSYSDPFTTTDGVAIIYLHRSLSTITFSYEEIKDYIRDGLALSELGQSLSAKTLWEQLDVEWVYD